MPIRQPDSPAGPETGGVLPAWILGLQHLRLADFCRACVDELPERLGYSAGAVYLFEPDAQALRLAESSIPGQVETVIELHGAATTEVARAVQQDEPPVFPPDGSTAGETWAAALRSAAGLEGALLLSGRSAAPSGPRVDPGLLLCFLGTALRHARQYEQVNLEARVDCLTGLYNLRWMREQLQHELRRVERFGGALSVLIIDIDGLKRVNDEAGHAAGDCVLRHVGARVRAALRNIDGAARVGGDEFVVMLPGTDAAGAEHAAERIRRLLARDLCCYRDRNLLITASIGVAEWQKGWSDVELLEAADRAMYAQKPR